ncbi:2-haloacid dehalogenase [Monaibacterium marinum]|uniref:2-haloacid dehalogenase n=1 Tax=Pontivivens marinum TaxID=1690039 RepID=A0A2C9CPK7_9RHOB|nr:HAD family phosphatase [Monaibacterium marinum]SOH93306.1 2-haloacid dehalogenase [Monaibacterium marinum]
MSNTPSAVIFDIGNVLIQWRPERLYAQIMPAEEMDRFFAAVDPHEMNDQIDRGAPFRETIYAHAEKFPEWANMIRLWHDRWIEMASPVIDDSVEMLRTLRANGVPCYALSNFGVESFAYAETCYPFLTEFDRRYISGHMRTAKPDAEIYQMVEADCGFSGPQLLFIDDKPENTAAAAQHGWQTHIFTQPAGLRTVLTDLDLPVP